MTNYVEIQTDTESEWLSRRQKSITATDIAKIRTGTDKAFKSLWKEKREPPKRFSNRFTEHGKEREPHIAQELAEAFPDLRHNTNFVVKDDRPEFGATPDMLGDGKFGIGEIKTRKITHESDMWETWDDVLSDPTGKKYACQFAWQFFVTGSEHGVFAVEHWSDEDGWVDLHPLRVFDVERDEALISGLHDVAERFLDWTPPELVQGDQGDFEAMAVAQALAEEESAIAALRAELRQREKNRAVLQADLLEAVGSDARSVDYGGFVVEVSPGRRSRSFDRKALAADYPELEKKYALEKDGAPSVKVLEKEE